MANRRYYSTALGTVRHASGRSYAAAAGGVIDLPESEQDELDWGSQHLVPLPRSGTTAQRPSEGGAQGVRPVGLGEAYIDTTAAKVVFYVGGGRWVDYTGAAA
jgi:hypothetical protein